MNIAPDMLKDAIDGVAFAAATEDSRPVLTGVQIELKEGTLVLAAADGFRLAVHETKVGEELPEGGAIIVPAKSLQEVSRMSSGKDQPVKIKVNEGKTQVLFQFENAAVVSQLIQGTFPNYSQLVPKEHVSKTTVDVGEFARATRAASIFARDGSGIVRLQTSEGGEDGVGGLSISARSEEVGDNQGEDFRHGGRETPQDSLQQQVPDGSLRCPGPRDGGAGNVQPLEPRGAEARDPLRGRNLRPRRHAHVRPVVA